MSDNVINLDDQRPHTIIQGIKATHVIPTSALEEMASGELKVSDTEQFDDFLPTIIQEWLELTND